MVKTSLETQDAICPKDSDGHPRFLTGGDGAWIIDAVGDRWIDFDNARGSVTLGHGHPAVAEAIGRAASGSLGVTTSWSPLAEAVIDRLHDACPSESIGLFRSGTAAVRAAVSAARASTD
ncbi:aminotransferase class III-fold pyridoxal phosphate-dependent enzyme, partial [Streptomyces sp. NPDC088270]|uniref:aminotransferase class III-fold pyridoxal phosphate-dependent enzyme n=1 Tax=Streptomyces sp. NPDC088270 TaxID=3160990 RepID=UPI003427C915